MLPPLTSPPRPNKIDRARVLTLSLSWRCYLSVVCWSTVHPWIRQTLTLDVGARVAVRSADGSNFTPSERLMILPSPWLLSGRSTAPSSGVSRGSHQCNLLGDTANLSTYPYLGISALCQFVGELLYGLEFVFALGGLGLNSSELGFLYCCFTTQLIFVLSRLFNNVGNVYGRGYDVHESIQDEVVACKGYDLQLHDGLTIASKQQAARWSPLSDWLCLLGSLGSVVWGFDGAGVDKKAEEARRGVEVMRSFIMK